jgi:hypothetical protein
VESVFSPPGWPGLKDALEVVLLLRESDISICPPPELPPNGGSGPWVVVLEVVDGVLVWLPLSPVLFGKPVVDVEDSISVVVDESGDGIVLDLVEVVLVLLPGMITGDAPGVTTVVTVWLHDPVFASNRWPTTDVTVVVQGERTSAGCTPAGLEVVDVDFALELVEVVVLDGDDVVRGIVELEGFEVVARKISTCQYASTMAGILGEIKEYELGDVVVDVVEAVDVAGIVDIIVTVWLHDPVFASNAWPTTEVIVVVQSTRPAGEELLFDVVVDVVDEVDVVDLLDVGDLLDVVDVVDTVEVVEVIVAFASLSATIITWENCKHLSNTRVTDVRTSAIEKIVVCGNSIEESQCSHESSPKIHNECVSRKNRQLSTTPWTKHNMHEKQQYGTRGTDTQIRWVEETIQERQTAWYYILWREAVQSVPGLSLIVPLTK